MPRTNTSSSPGEMLQSEFMPRAGMFLKDVSLKSGIPIRALRELIAESRPITLIEAEGLHRCFPERSAEYWIRLQRVHDFNQGRTR